jgi:phosphoribosylaminoimidazolecarboxamide formyltransferase/IMP cyclohydrolase
MTTRRALLSLSDKTGLVEFARGLVDNGFQLLSTGGTAKTILAAGLPVTQVSDYTGAPEILGGRVKTLHPKIAGGVLARPTPEHRAELSAHHMEEIDLVVVNLYPFREAVARQAPRPEIIEEIDIGGPTLLRAAAKNYARVTVVCDPADYSRVLAAFSSSGATDDLRFQLAAKAFAHTAAYDAAISAYFSQELGEHYPPVLHLGGPLARTLRYGENPHQSGALYDDPSHPAPRLTSAPLQGKELSFTNLLDLDGALAAVREFSEPACVAVKHATPCGIAQAGTALDAYRAARDADPVSVFGGVVALNRAVDGTLADEMSKTFLEAIVAPEFSPEAREIFSAKKNLRLLAVGDFGPLPARGPLDLRRVAGGFLVQDRDAQLTSPRQGKVVTQRAPSDAEWDALELAWRAVKHVKSNAIVLANRAATLGMGAGQMSRVDAARLAVDKAREFKKEIAGCAAGSDAFFPFRDGLEVLAKAGVRAVAQPGGSVRDEEVIALANEYDIAMVFVGERHFRH